MGLGTISVKRMGFQWGWLKVSGVALKVNDVPQGSYTLSFTCFSNSSSTVSSLGLSLIAVLGLDGILIWQCLFSLEIASSTSLR